MHKSTHNFWGNIKIQQQQAYFELFGVHWIYFYNQQTLYGVIILFYWTHMRYLSMQVTRNIRLRRVERQKEYMRRASRHKHRELSTRGEDHCDMSKNRRRAPWCWLSAKVTRQRRLRRIELQEAYRRRALRRKHHDQETIGEDRCDAKNIEEELRDLNIVNEQQWDKISVAQI